MIVFDAHLDLAWNAIDWNRDLKKTVWDIRKDESGMSGRCRGNATVSLPQMREGKVALAIATLLPKLIREVQPPLQFFQSREAAYASARGQLAYYRTLEESGQVRLLTTADELNAHTTEWLTDESGDHPLGFVLSMEGADAFISADQAEHWYDLGLRIVGPAHYGLNAYANGTGSPGGFTSEGKDLLRQMQKAGLLLDVTHLADDAFWEAMDIYDGPVLASHHNCRSLVSGDRQLTDEQIRVLLDRDAVIGSAFDCWMLDPSWIRGQEEWATVGMEVVVDHMDHICQIAGNSKHVALGTDLDGGFGKEQSPTDMDTIADLQKLSELLQTRGYSPEDIKGIMYRNWVDFFNRVWS